MKLNTNKTEGECKCICHYADKEVLSKAGAFIPIPFSPSELLMSCKHCKCDNCQPTSSLYKEKPSSAKIMEATDRITARELATEKPMEDWDKDCQICQMEKVAEHPNHKIGVSSTKQSGTKDVTPNLAEYKQKLIKRLKKTRTPMSGKEKNWWIDFNTVKKALDEVEAVIRVSEG